MTQQETVSRRNRLWRIRSCACAMKWAVTACVAAFCALTIALAVSILFPELSVFGVEETIPLGETERSFAGMQVSQRASLVGILCVSAVLQLGVIWTLRKLFGQFQRAEFFSSKTLETVVSLGIWLISVALFDVVSEPLASLIATLDYPKAEWVVDVSIDGGEIFCTILGALMLLYGWIMREAALLAEENRQII